VIAFRVIDEVMAPKIQAGHPDDAVTAAIDSLTGVVGGQANAPPATAAAPEHSKPLTLFQWTFYGIAGILILALVITHPALAFYLLANIMSGGGGGGGGGGGFSGGGGRSGGGGASGSW
jgi:uncharacterized protein